MGKHEDRIFSVPELAKFLGVNPAAIYQGVKRGTIPHFKVGQQIRFRFSEIDKWMKKGGTAGKED